MSEHNEFRKPKPYMNPYLAGIGIGIVLLMSYVIMGRGLGSSGAISSVLTVGVDAVAHQHANANPVYSEYLGDGSSNPLKDWLVFEVLGVLAGGFISGMFAGRVKKTIEKGPRVTNKARLTYAVIGGMLMGIGAKLGRGCTSGQALTGGSILNLGSWVFMLCIFGGAYMLAYFMRRQWT